MIRFPTLFAALWLLCACLSAGEQGGLLFSDAWVRAMPPGSMMTAGFGRLVNDGDSDMLITGWSSEQFGNVSLHQTVDTDGVSRMQSVPELKLAAGAELGLEPGGYHLMLMKPADGELQTVRIQALLSDGRTFSFELPVERR